jgi:hypothetical protein
MCIFFNLRLDAGLHARHLSTHAQQQLKQLARSRALPVYPSQHKYFVEISVDEILV